MWKQRYCQVKESYLDCRSAEKRKRERKRVSERERKRKRKKHEGGGR